MDFEDIAGWTVETAEGAEASCRAPASSRCGGSMSARWSTTRHFRRNSQFIIRPPPAARHSRTVRLRQPVAALQPLVVGEPAGHAAGDRVGGYHRRHGQPIHRLPDHHAVAGVVAGPPADRSGDPQADPVPCQFTGLEFRGGSQKDWRTFYFDSLSCYTEELKPLTVRARPRRNLTLFEGQPAGQNTGAGQAGLPDP